MSIMLKSSFSLLGLVRDTDSFPTRRSSDLDDVPLGDQTGQLTRGERLPGEVVQPDGHARVADPLECVGGVRHRQFPSLPAAEAAAIDSFAAATVASAVRPNCSNSVL